MITIVHRLSALFLVLISLFLLMFHPISSPLSSIAAFPFSLSQNIQQKMTLLLLPLVLFLRLLLIHADANTMLSMVSMAKSACLYALMQIQAGLNVPCCFSQNSSLFDGRGLQIFWYKGHII